MDWVIARVREPSTWNSLATLLVGAHVVGAGSPWVGVVTAGGAFAAAILGAVMPEKKA